MMGWSWEWLVWWDDHGNRDVSSFNSKLDVLEGIQQWWDCDGNLQWDFYMFLLHTKPYSKHYSKHTISPRRPQHLSTFRRIALLSPGNRKDRKVLVIQVWAAKGATPILVMMPQATSLGVSGWFKWCFFRMAWKPPKHIQVRQVGLCGTTNYVQLNGKIKHVQNHQAVNKCVMKHIRLIWPKFVIHLRTTIFVMIALMIHLGKLQWCWAILGWLLLSTMIPGLGRTMWSLSFAQMNGLPIDDEWIVNRLLMDD